MDMDPREPRPGIPPPTWSGRLRGLTMDLSPLRESRDLRLLYLGNLASSFGNEVTYVVVAFQVFQLTHSTLAVGLLGLCYLIPLLLLSLLGGAIADTVDRRLLLLTTETVGMVTPAGLAFNAVLESPLLWPLYAFSILSATVYALGSPGFRSAIPRLVRKEKIPAAAALGFITHNVGAIAGPAVAGIGIAAVGLAATYGLDVVTFVVSLVTASLLHPIPPDPDQDRVSIGAILEGFRFLKGKQVLQGSFVVDLNATIFGMPNALFPAVAARLGGGASVVGLLYAAPSVGSLLTSLTSGWTSRIQRQGLAVYGGVIAWGASLVLFGLAGTLWLSVVALCLAGAADTVSGIFRVAIMQTATPAHMMGRLEGLSLMVVATGPSLGDVEAGALASLTTVPFSIVFGGITCILGVGLMAWRMPGFARYDHLHPTP
jgi:MFS family permease